VKLTPVETAVLRALVHKDDSQWGLHIRTGRRVTYPLLDRLRERGLVWYNSGSSQWQLTASGRSLVTDSATSAEEVLEVSGVTPMPGAGLEPARPEGRGILSPLRLPIPPPGRPRAMYS
jgi:hypothetical protein